MFKKLMLFSCILMVGLTSACGLETYQSGDLPTPKRLNAIHTGDSRDKIIRLLGTPLYDSTGILPATEGSILLYGRIQSESRAFLPPKETDRLIYAFILSNQNTVTDIRTLTGADKETVVFDTDTTPTGGTQLSALEQIAKNFGRYDAGGRDSNTRR